jgi:hypothetical protein
MVGESLEKEFGAMSDQELIGIVRSKSDVLQDQCFDPWDLIVLGYAMLELEKRGYCVEFSIQTGIEKCPCRQNGGGADE